MSSRITEQHMFARLQMIYQSQIAETGANVLELN